jgi:hypothetical protein
MLLKFARQLLSKWGSRRQPEAVVINDAAKPLPPKPLAIFANIHRCIGHDGIWRATCRYSDPPITFCAIADSKEELHEKVMTSMTDFDWLYEWDVVAKGNFVAFDYDTVADYMSGRKSLHLVI